MLKFETCQNSESTLQEEQYESRYKRRNDTRSVRRKV